jgi:hypothetical protein
MECRGKTINCPQNAVPVASKLAVAGQKFGKFYSTAHAGMDSARNSVPVSKKAPQSMVLRLPTWVRHSMPTERSPAKLRRMWHDIIQAASDFIFDI